jgi:hypothetical protein
MYFPLELVTYPPPYSVHAWHPGTLERAWEERRHCVRLMMPLQE